jgi:hypothetical protein
MAEVQYSREREWNKEEEKKNKADAHPQMEGRERGPQNRHAHTLTGRKDPVGQKELSPPHALMAYSFSWIRDIIIEERGAGWLAAALS